MHSQRRTRRAYEEKPDQPAAVQVPVSALVLVSVLVTVVVPVSALACPALSHEQRLSLHGSYDSLPTDERNQRRIHLLVSALESSYSLSAVE